MSEDFNLLLDPQESAFIQQYNDGLKVKKVQRINLVRLIKTWGVTARDAESGCGPGLDVYASDLWVRILLDEFIQIAPSSLQLKINSALQPLDERFRIATVPIKRPICQTGVNLERSWWVYRVPRVMSEKLRLDLIETGYLEE